MEFMCYHVITIKYSCFHRFNETSWWMPQGVVTRTMSESYWQRALILNSKPRYAICFRLRCAHILLVYVTIQTGHTRVAVREFSSSIWTGFLTHLVSGYDLSLAFAAIIFRSEVSCLTALRFLSSTYHAKNMQYFRVPVLIVFVCDRTSSSP